MRPVNGINKECLGINGQHSHLEGCNGTKASVCIEYRTKMDARRHPINSKKYNPVNNPLRKLYLQYAIQKGWKFERANPGLKLSSLTSEQQAELKAFFATGQKIECLPPSPKQWQLSDEELALLLVKAKARATSIAKKKTVTKTINLYERNPTIRKYVIYRSKGICEFCKEAARYFKPNGAPILEPHHVEQVSNGGADAIYSVAAIHPDCHRAAHHSNKAAVIKATLTNFLIGLYGVTA